MTTTMTEMAAPPVAAGDVAPADSPAFDPAEGVKFGPILVWSIGLTTLIMWLGIGIPMWLLTGEVWDGIGLGAFCAFWGGPGFGVMVAGATWTARNERR